MNDIIKATGQLASQWRRSKRRASYQISVSQTGTYDEVSIPDLNSTNQVSRQFDGQQVLSTKVELPHNPAIRRDKALGCGLPNPHNSTYLPYARQATKYVRAGRHLPGRLSHLTHLHLILTAC